MSRVAFGAACGNTLPGRRLQASQSSECFVLDEKTNTESETPQISPKSPVASRTRTISSAEKSALAQAIGSPNSPRCQTAKAVAQLDLNEGIELPVDSEQDEADFEEAATVGRLSLSRGRSHSLFRHVPEQEPEDVEGLSPEQQEELIREGKWKALEEWIVDLNDFEKVKTPLLGKGTFGAVTKWRQKSTNQLVAVKSVYLRKSDVTVAWEREVVSMANLTHPALVKFIGFVPPDDDGWKVRIVMELMNNGSLDEMVKQKSKNCPEWTPVRKHVILYGIACGMRFIHSHGYTHRDLKPHNVLLDDDLEPKISDFGSARLMDSDISTTFCGTPAYMAPELLRGCTYGPKVDVFSFAVTMYVILTGILPTRTKDQLIASRQPTIPENICDEYRELMEVLWREKPDERPTFDEIVNVLGDEHFFPQFVRDPVFVAYQKKVAPDLVRENIDSSPEISPETKPETELDAISSLKKMADGGDANAQFNYGQLLEQGDVVDKDITAAATYYKLSADQGNCDGMVALATLLLDRGNNENFAEAARYLQLAVDQGNLVAMDTLGTVCRYGIGVPINEHKAVILFAKAAMKGYSEAQVHYGEMLEEGRGCDKSLQAAKRFYRESAKGGCAKGMYKYAEMLCYGQGKNKRSQLSKAVTMYERAAHAGNNDALYSLCEIYRNGLREIRKNEKKAAYYAKMGRDRGDFICTVQLAEMYRDGLGVKRNPTKSEELFTYTRQPCFADWQNNYGYRLCHGQGCKANLPLAAEYYKIAAENGNAPAMFNLGCMYRDGGHNFAKDPSQAAIWVRKAAESGFEVALYEYGCYLADGYGVTKDEVQGLKFLQQAAEQGYIDAFRTVGRMIELGKGCAASPETAVGWYQRAVEMGDVFAYAFLADMYERGAGTEKNFEEAVRLYKLGVKNGSEMAMERLALMYLDGRGVSQDTENPRETARKLLYLAKEFGSKKAPLMIQAFNLD